MTKIKRYRKISMVLVAVITLSFMVTTSYATEKANSPTFYECMEETQEVFSDAENHIPTEIKNKMDAQSDALIAYDKLISSFAKNDDNQFVYPADFAGAYINDKG